MSTDVIAAAYASAHKGNPLASPEKQIIEAGIFRGHLSEIASARKAA